MAALSTATTATSITEVIPAEQISDFVRGYQYNPTVAEFCAWIENLGPRQGATLAFPAWEQTSVPAGQKTETDLFSDVEMTLAENTVTVGFVGMSIPVSREASHDSQLSFPQSIVVEGGRAMRNRIDSDLLALITSASDSTGADTDALTLSRFLTGLASFKALNPPSEAPTAFIGSRGQIDALLSDLGSSTATLVGKTANMSDATRQPYCGSLYGVEIFESANAPTSGAGKAGCFVSMGDKASALGLVVSEPVGVEIEPDPRRKVDYLVVSARYGVGLVSPFISELISSS